VANRASIHLGLAFSAVHLACLFVFVVGISWFTLALVVVSYMVRGFAVTAVYHRLLAHNAYRASRFATAVGTALATAAAQKGPLWWVAHHRRHHRASDGPDDVHSPRQVGFWRAHCGWQFRPENRATRIEEVTDLAQLPEMRFLDRYHYVAPVGFAVLVFFTGMVVGRVWPSTGTNGPQALVWAFFVTTVALYHVTFSVNSVAHRFGRRRFATRDDSRNNWVVALFALGEGWHNNHHRFAGSARHGFRRAEFDATHALLRLLARVGIVSGLRPVPVHLWIGDVARAPRGAVAAAEGADGS
jgi:stearoyl-CoA desaturase (delta-9 desaturase)